jgi:acetyltransferase-like isoleucine patch superfamily enzyme
LRPDRTLPWDWYPGKIPENVVIDDEAYLESSYSFHYYRSRMTEGVRIGRGASAYQGTLFDVGPGGRVSIGEFTLVNGAWIICDGEVEIGDYGLISWNVVLMDSYRLPFDPEDRRGELMKVPFRDRRMVDGQVESRPIRIGRNVWIGFDACVLPGVTIGEGSIIGARSVVFEDVLPYSVVVGNPARVVRTLNREPTSS